MAKVVYKGRKMRMVFGFYVHEGHVLHISDSLARTLAGDKDFVITYSKPDHQPALPQGGEEHPDLVEEKPVVKKKRGKKK